jgi:hypothetical protein
LRKNAIFSPKIAENRDHNIDPSKEIFDCGDNDDDDVVQLVSLATNDAAQGPILLF